MQCVGEDVSLMCVLRAVEKVVIYGFVHSWADGTMRRFAPADTVQVVVEWDMSGADLGVYAGLAFRMSLRNLLDGILGSITLARA
jgi:hypothetical protein